VRPRQRVVEVGSLDLSIDARSPYGSEAFELFETDAHTGIEKSTQRPFDTLLANQLLDVAQMDSRLLHQEEIGTGRPLEDPSIEDSEEGALA
jgi:hypothetical protein